MEAVKREDADGGEVGGGGGGAGGEREGAAPPRPPLPRPLLDPQASNAKQRKERHIVSWTQQEDDLLREQVRIHGTQNWTCIAAQLKDKTSRQCRRRWFSYLNTECKKGGWSPEEDMILCEAQKIFGNRWTEIAKVVSGRTDNAVKNRFTTLCKKRAKNEAVPKENNCSYPTLNRENCVHQTGCVTAVQSEEPSTALKRMRYQIAGLTENTNMNEGSFGEDKMDKGNMRDPLSELVPNFDNVGGLLDQQDSAKNLKSVHNDENALNKFQGTFNRSDDPKISSLIQHVELLSSLSQKVCTENSDHALENAWKELKDYLVQNGDTGPASSEASQVDFLLDDVEDLDDSRCSSARSHPSVRQLDICEHSQLSTVHGSGSIYGSDVPADSKLLCAEESTIQHHCETKSLPEDGAQIGGNTSQEVELPSGSLDSISAAIMTHCEEPKKNNQSFLMLPDANFSSPLQTMPIFKPLSEGDPSPKFSASERQFLLSALGLSSSSPNMNPSQQPSCKKALLHSL